MIPRRFVFTADLHIHPHRVGSKNGGTDRLQDGLSVLQQSLALAQREQAGWVFGGDLKQPQSYWPQQALNGILSTFASYPDVPKVFIPGNHDGLAGAWGSGLRPLMGYGSVIERPAVLDGLALWPLGTRDLSGFADFVASAKRAKARILIAHAYVEGVALGPDSTRLSGHGVSREVLRLDAFRLALLGDIHKAQRWMRGRGGWESGWEQTAVDYAEWAFDDVAAGYPGSPYMQNWGEREDGRKGVLLIDRDHETIQWHALASPAFVLHDWTARVLPATEAKIKTALRAWLTEGRRGPYDMVRVRLPQRWLAVKVIAEHLAEEAESGAHRTFDVIPVPSPTTETRSTLSASMSPRELLASYVDAKPPPEGISPAVALEALTRLV